MAPSNPLQYRRTHNLLLINKLLNFRENASPFTLILDSLEQRGRPLLREMMRRANASKVEIIYISYETLRKPRDVKVFILAPNLSPMELQKKISALLSPARRSLLIFDTLHPLLTNSAVDILNYLSSLPTATTSLAAIYHTDIPLQTKSPYSPAPLVLLKYTATTILTLDNFSHVCARKEAGDRSVGEPVFGLEEGVEGVIVGLGSQGRSEEGVVCEMEYRRKSGRSVVETFFIPTSLPNSYSKGIPGKPNSSARPGSKPVILLEDHPLYARPTVEETAEEVESTFSLGLTEKQRRDREGVVLPYFDAQESGGSGEGGRILYDLGVEDDFDEEEDEI